MKRNKLIALAVAVVMLAGLSATDSQATMWYLDTSNVDLGLTGNFASVDISVHGNTATFTIDVNQALLGAGSNFGIDKFFFDTTLSSITKSDFGVQSGWSVSTSKEKGAPFGKFELLYKGTGHSRTDPLTFSITDRSITSAMDFYEANPAGYHFAAHIGGFPLHNGQSSAVFTDGGSPAPVPEPSALLLLGAGLAGFAAYRKWFKKA